MGIESHFIFYHSKIPGSVKYNWIWDFSLIYSGFDS